MKHAHTIKTPGNNQELVAGLQTQPGNPDLLIEGFHLFSFNDVERTEKWRMETFNRLSG